jgi:hypothetical protein
VARRRAADWAGFAPPPECRAAAGRGRAGFAPQPAACRRAAGWAGFAPCRRRGALAVAAEASAGLSPDLDAPAVRRRGAAGLGGRGAVLRACQAPACRAPACRGPEPQAGLGPAGVGLVGCLPPVASPPGRDAHPRPNRRARMAVPRPQPGSPRKKQSDCVSCLSPPLVSPMICSVPIVHERANWRG